MIDATENQADKTAVSTPSGAENPRARKPASYVLMTAAHNEEADIERTIQSIVAQTVRPERWLIASDNSTDRTDEIIQKYADQYSFIRFHRVVRQPGRDFASKVLALRSGQHLLEGASYDFIGNFDADLSVAPTYFENLMRQFERNPRLGLTGGFVYEKVNGEFASRKVNQVYSVSHAAQLVRRECYEAIGGYAVLKYGGEDWHAQTSARMHGWEVYATPELPVYHYRPTGGATNFIRSSFRLGKLDYSFGTYPSFQLIKCASRLHKKPFVIGAVIRMAGFLDSYIRREPFLLSSDLVAHLRQEQADRMRALFRRSGPASNSDSSGSRNDVP
jgi:glycosyltransferase involved in cell wall biosynthesis